MVAFFAMPFHVLVAVPVAILLGSVYTMIVQRVASTERYRLIPRYVVGEKSRSIAVGFEVPVALDPAPSPSPPRPRGRNCRRAPEGQFPGIRT